MECHRVIEISIVNTDWILDSGSAGLQNLNLSNTSSIIFS